MDSFDPQDPDMVAVLNVMEEAPHSDYIDSKQRRAIDKAVAACPCTDCALTASCNAAGPPRHQGRGITVSYCERWDKYSPAKDEYKPKRWVGL